MQDIERQEYEAAIKSLRNAMRGLAASLSANPDHQIYVRMAAIDHAMTISKQHRDGARKVRNVASQLSNMKYEAKAK